MGYDPINKMPHIQRMNSLRGDPVDLDGSKINIQDKEVTPDKIKRAVSSSFSYNNTCFWYYFSCSVCKLADIRFGPNFAT